MDDGSDAVDVDVDEDDEAVNLGTEEGKRLSTVPTKNCLSTMTWVFDNYRILFLLLHCAVFVKIVSPTVDACWTQW